MSNSPSFACTISASGRATSELIRIMTAFRNAQAEKARATDIEKQLDVQDSVDTDDIDARHLAILQTLFKLSPDQMRQVRALPSPAYWCRHLEQCFEPLLSERYADVWTSLKIPQPKEAAQCWDLFRTVSAAITKLEDAGHSIEDVWESTMLSHNPDSKQQAPATLAFEPDGHCLRAIFAMLCWTSMIFQPQLVGQNDTTASCLAIVQPSGETQCLKMDFAQRPVTAVIRSFQKTRNRRLLIRAPTKDGGTTLFVSTINYDSLRTIGKVGLKWVDDLSSHLSFDPRTRTLSVFRLPSFCACTTIGGDRGNLFEELVQTLFSSGTERSHESECSNLQLSQEVIMSYRLLFGQSRAARRVGRSLVQKLGSKRQCDQLLVTLCTKPQKEVNKHLPACFWPMPCRTFDGRLQEAECYSSQDDFPMLGYRLAALQDFNLRQQPSELRDLWRDRRNPLQWYTFWAVLVVGGISNVVAILQLAVAIVQILL